MRDRSPFCQKCSQPHLPDEPAVASVYYPLSRNELIAQGLNPADHMVRMCADCLAKWLRIRSLKGGKENHAGR